MRYGDAFCGSPDLVLDLCGTNKQASARTWSVSFDEGFGEASAVAAILGGRAPIVAVIDARTGKSIASGRPGTEMPGIVLSAFEDCLARTTTLIVAAATAAVDPAAAPLRNEGICAADLRCTGSCQICDEIARAPYSASALCPVLSCSALACRLAVRRWSRHDRPEGSPTAGLARSARRWLAFLCRPLSQ